MELVHHSSYNFSAMPKLLHHSYNSSALHEILFFTLQIFPCLFAFIFPFFFFFLFFSTSRINKTIEELKTSKKIMF